MTARIEFSKEDRKRFEGGIPTGLWTGRTRGLSFKRIHGDSKKSGRPYDIRRITLSVAAIAPLSGEEVPDGKVEEVHLAQEFQVRSIVDIGRRINDLMDEFDLDVGEGDVKQFQDALLATADTNTGVVNYDAVKEAVAKFGKNFSNKNVTFTLNYNPDNEYDRYSISNVVLAAGE
jgi:hypothetical protein